MNECARYKNFLGTIEQIEQSRFLISGEISRLSRNRYEITELPIKTWTQAYKESVLEPMQNGTEKAPALITEYKEYNTDTTVKFIISVVENKLDKVHR